jgi:hypothetical protein
MILALALLLQQPAVPLPIADNSFLIEEAYNQEARVVQHINTLMRFNDAWAYSFTQEWPAGGQRHQLSYTVPVTTGLGDVALNYRHQLVATERVAFAPRVSVILPTGDETEGLGTGSTGYQVNLPLSVVAGPSLVTHWNLGATFTPGIDETGYSGGASAIWRAHPLVNVMLELAWAGSEGEDLVLLNPGVRWAHNLGSLQIVPGVAMPIDLGPGTSSGVFVYLSLEHPF